VRGGKRAVRVFRDTPGLQAYPQARDLGWKLAFINHGVVTIHMDTGAVRVRHDFTSRAAFEAWLRGTVGYFGTDWDLKGEDGYSHSMVQGLWLAWQAGIQNGLDRLVKKR
jgi:hypothetical protein